MVYINETGKVNQVWLDRKYLIPTCVSGDSGYDEGFEDGYDSGFTDGYDSGYTDGSEDGYESGFTGGYDSGVTDGWQPGYDSGVTDGKKAQKALMTTLELNITQNNTSISGSREAGWNRYRLQVNVPSGATIKNQNKRVEISGGTFETINYEGHKGYYWVDTFITADSGYTGLGTVSALTTLWADDAISYGEELQKKNLRSVTFSRNGTYTRETGWSAVTVDIDTSAVYQEGYDSGYTDGLNAQGGDYASGYTAGEEAQKAKLDFRTFTKNGYYTRPDGWSAVSVNVPQTGYTQADLDAAFASGYSAGLNDCTGWTPSDSMLEMTYVTTGANQEIALFGGTTRTGGDSNTFFFEFYSGITRMEVDGIPVPKNTANIKDDYDGEMPSGISLNKHYAYTFVEPGRHVVTFYISQDYVWPATTVSDQSFARRQDANRQNICPLVEAVMSAEYTHAQLYPFQQQTGLTAVTFNSSVPPTRYLDNALFDGCTNLGAIYVPADAVQAYKTSWPDYASLIQAMP